VQLIPTWHRAYARAHPLAPAISLGILLGGLVNLFAPKLVEETASSVVLPELVLLLFNLTWAIGGAAATVGFFRGWLKLDAAGSLLIAGGLGAYYIVLISLRSTTALTAVFIALLAIGSALRAVQLFRHGYVQL
jgi:hypothetical protein